MRRYDMSPQLEPHTTLVEGRVVRTGPCWIPSVNFLIKENFFPQNNAYPDMFRVKQGMLNGRGAEGICVVSGGGAS